MLPDCLLALLTTPVDDDDGTIRCLGKMTGGIGRQPEDGWSAHAPMGEQQWTVGTVLGACEGDGDISDDGAHQRFVDGGNGEGEERWNGRFYL